MKFFYASVIPVRLLFLFCSRVFISRSYENRSNPTLKTNHYDIIRLQLERNYEFDDDGYARYQSRSSPPVEEQDRTREAGGNRT